MTQDITLLPETLRGMAIGLDAQGLHDAADTCQLAADEIERLRAELDPNRMKIAVCDYLLSLNEEDTFIPPTAIDWMGNGIVKAIIAGGTP